MGSGLRSVGWQRHSIRITFLVILFAPNGFVDIWNGCKGIEVSYLFMRQCDYHVAGSYNTTTWRHNGTIDGCAKG